MIKKKLKILNIAPFPVYSPRDGGAIIFLNRSFLLSEKGHEIDFVIFKDSSQDVVAKNAEPEEFEKKFNDKVYIIKKKNKLKSFLKSVFSLNPHALFKHKLDKAESKNIINLLRSKHYDIVLFETIHSYPCYKLIKKELKNQNIKSVYFSHNIYYKDIYNLYKESNNYLRKFFYFVESLKYKRIESLYIKKFSLIFTVSLVDKNILTEINPDAKVIWIPAIINAGSEKLDIENTDINANLNKGYKVEAEKLNNELKLSGYNYKILFTGSLAYISNIIAVKWFSEKVMPILLKNINCCFIVVGRNPSDEIFDLVKNNKDIIIFPNVESVTPFYNIADLVVVPLFNDAGVKIKLVEALKFRKKVIARPEGVRGSGLRNIIQTAETPEDFAKKCIGILRSETHDDSFWKEFDDIYNNDKIIGNFENILFDYIN